MKILTFLCIFGRHQPMHFVTNKQPFLCFAQTHKAKRPFGYPMIDVKNGVSLFICKKLSSVCGLFLLPLVGARPLLLNARKN